MVEPVSKTRWLEMTYQSSRRWVESPERLIEEDSDFDEELNQDLDEGNFYHDPNFIFN